MPISAPIDSLFGKGKRSSLNIGNIISSLRGPGQAPMVSALTQIQDAIHSIENAMQRPAGGVKEFAVTRPDGSLLAWFGTRVVNGELFSGFWTAEAYIGADGPDNAPFFSDGSTVIIGKNGQVWIQDIGGNNVAWLGTTSEAPLTITGATSASPSVVTITGHPFVDGDTIRVANTTATLYRIVENTTANTFTMTDLSGAAINGNAWFSGTTTAERYYAGLLTQTMAIGESFEDYKLRAFANGDLRINNARIELTGPGGTILLDPDIPVILADGAAGYSSFAPGEILVYAPGGANPHTAMFSAQVVIFDNAGAVVGILDGSSGTAVSLSLSGGSGATITSTGKIRTNDKYNHNGTDGISATRNMVASVSTSGSGVFGTPGVGQSNGTVVTGVTLTSTTFAGGIITA